MVGADAVSGQFQRGAVFGRDLRDFRVDLFLREGEGFGGEGKAVEAMGQFDHRLIATAADIGDDLRHRLIDIFGFLTLLAEEGLEGSLEVRVGGGQENGHRGLRLVAVQIARGWPSLKH